MHDAGEVVRFTKWIDLARSHRVEVVFLAYKQRRTRYNFRPEYRVAQKGEPLSCCHHPRSDGGIVFSCVRLCVRVSVCLSTR